MVPCLRVNWSGHVAAGVMDIDLNAARIRGGTKEVLRVSVSACPRGLGGSARLRTSRSRQAARRHRTIAARVDVCLQRPCVAIACGAVRSGVATRRRVTDTRDLDNGDQCQEVLQARTHHGHQDLRDPRAIQGVTRKKKLDQARSRGGRKRSFAHLVPGACTENRTVSVSANLTERQLVGHPEGPRALNRGSRSFRESRSENLIMRNMRDMRMSAMQTSAMRRRARTWLQLHASTMRIVNRDDARVSAEIRPVSFHRRCRGPDYSKLAIARDGLCGVASVADPSIGECARLGGTTSLRRRRVIVFTCSLTDRCGGVRV